MHTVRQGGAHDSEGGGCSGLVVGADVATTSLSFRNQGPPTWRSTVWAADVVAAGDARWAGRSGGCGARSDTASKHRASCHGRDGGLVRRPRRPRLPLINPIRRARLTRKCCGISTFRSSVTSCARRPPPAPARLSALSRLRGRRPCRRCRRAWRRDRVASPGGRARPGPCGPPASG